MMKTFILTLEIIRNLAAFFAAVIVLMTVIFGVLMTNEEIRSFGMLSIKVFVVSIIVALIVKAIKHFTKM